MTLDATVGGAASNSFVTLAEFNHYLETRLHLPASVISASSTNKEKALMWSSRLISALCWLGSGSTDTQRLSWPRLGLVYGTGFAIPGNVLPQELKDAVCELAFLLLQKDTTLPNQAAVQGLTKIKAGSVELGFKNEIVFSAVPDSVKALLPEGWLCPAEEEAELLFENLPGF